jgi:membrane protein DedA with SNARE-associated domain
VQSALLDPTSFVTSSGYAAIFVLSVLQSCCVPTSSEITLGFAGVLAARGQLSLPGVIAAGASGEVVGAYIAWVIGRTGGRGFVDRFGRYLLLSHRDLDRAEAWYQRRGRWGVFVSRLLPVIRNFVALPAGVAEVPLVRFGLLTAAGSLIWDAAMALIGYEVGGSYSKVMHGFSDAGYLLGGVVVIALAAVIWHRWRSYREATDGDVRHGAHAAGRGGDGSPRPRGADPAYRDPARPLSRRRRS